MLNIQKVSHISVESVHWHVPGRLLRQNHMDYHVQTGASEFMNRNIINRASKRVNEHLENVDLKFVRISEFKKILKQKIFCYETSLN